MVIQVMATSLTNHSSVAVSRAKMATDSSPVVDMSVVTNNRRALGVAQSTEAFLYDMISEKTVHTWRHHVAPIKSFQFSPVSDNLGFTASYDFRFKLFDLRTAEIVNEERFERPLQQAAFLDGMNVLLLDLSGFVHKLDLRNFPKRDVLFGDIDTKASGFCIPPETFDYSMLDFQVEAEQVSVDSFNLSTLSELDAMSPPRKLSATKTSRKNTPSASPNVRYKTHVPSPLAVRHSNIPPPAIQPLDVAKATSTPRIEEDVENFFPVSSGEWSDLRDRLARIEDKLARIQSESTEKRLDDLAKKMADTLEILELKPHSELSLNLRAEMQVYVLTPIVRKIEDSLEWGQVYIRQSLESERQANEFAVSSRWPNYFSIAYRATSASPKATRTPARLQCPRRLSIKRMK